MKYPSTLRVCISSLALLTIGFFGNSQLYAQSQEEKSTSVSTEAPQNSRAAPSVIFRIENTLTPPSEYFEYLDMNLAGLEQVSPGVFHIYGLQTFRTYSIEFKGNGPMLLGVTTADISKIQRYILGKGTLDPDRIIAADVNGDERVSASDLVDIRKVLLGVYPSFSCGVSWKFVPASAEFLYVGTTIDLGTIKAIKVGHVN